MFVLATSVAFRTKTVYERAFCNRAEIPVDVGVSYFGRHDRSRACPLARRRDLRRYGTVPLHTCRRQFAFPLLVERNRDEVLSLGIVRPAYSVSPFTAIRNYGSVNALRTRTFCNCTAPCLSIRVLAGFLSRRGQGVSKIRFPRFLLVPRYAGTGP